MFEDVSELLKKIIHFSKLCHRLGYVGGSSGNVSFRSGESMWISNTGTMLGELSEDDFSCVEVTSGTVLRGRTPSKEREIHRLAYARRLDCHAVLHLHPVDCIAAGILLGPKTELPFYVPSHFIKLGTVHQTGFYKAGSLQLAQECSVFLQNENAALLYRHGTVTLGKSIEEAFMRSEYLLEACRLHLKFQGAHAMSKEELAAYKQAPADVFISKDEDGIQSCS